MKDLLTASLVLVLLLGGWLTFIHYAEKESQDIINKIENEILPGIEEENWKENIKNLKNLSEEWHKFRRITLFFLDTDTINQIDYGMAEAIMYAQAKDPSNSSGTLAAMIEQLSFLTEHERLTLQNIL